MHKGLSFCQKEAWHFLLSGWTVSMWAQVESLSCVYPSEGAAGGAGQDWQAHQVLKRQGECQTSGQTWAVSWCFCSDSSTLMSGHDREFCVTFCKNINAQDGIRGWRSGRIHAAGVFSCVPDFSTSSPWSRTSLAECSASSSSPASLSACRP